MQKNLIIYELTQITTVNMWVNILSRSTALGVWVQDEILFMQIFPEALEHT